ncbi:MAG: HAMP domain-containing histidine kinase [Chloroflexi bacterium]|nr:HAMP domain-containing histidine kinase [Chloroflexota bacterium]MBP8057824.1 HAMP domain-containing histidine kinase [Chloroflexota bacterium]
MNRLWVRFSLIILGVILFVIITPFLFRGVVFPLLGQDREVARELFPQVLETLPSETVDRIAQFFLAELISSLVAYVVVSAVAALLVGSWVGRTLTRPLQQLEKAANAIKAGELNQNVPAQGSREMVAMATAFNGMAAQLSQAETLRKNLLADVAHELRHPIHILQGNLQAILDDVYPLSKEEIARLADQTQHLTRLVQDLHDLSQAEAHQLPLHRQEMEVADVVKDAAATYKPLASGRHIDLHVELLGAIPTIQGDPARLRQVMLNLLDNALRHTPDGGKVVVTVQKLAGRLQVQVRDSGSGISPEHLPFVFDRFYKLDRGRERSGTGLGLAIAKAVVEAHGGEIAAASQGAGQGSTFTLGLPL